MNREMRRQIAQSNVREIPRVQDTRLERVKVVRYSASFLVNLPLVPRNTWLQFSADIPVATQVLNIGPYQQAMPDGQMEVGVELLLHHPSFPMHLEGVGTPIIPVTIASLQVEPTEPEETDAPQE